MHQPFQDVATLGSHYYQVTWIRREVGQRRPGISFRRFDPDVEISRETAGGGAEGTPDQACRRLSSLISLEGQDHEVMAIAAMAPATVLRQAERPGPDGHQFDLL